MVFVSLISKKPQLIPPNVYTALRFDEESADMLNWHAVADLTQPASALIIPTVTNVGMVAGMVFWAGAPTTMASAPTQYLARITRDPYDAVRIDSTATHDRAPTPGAQFDVFSWPMTVRAGQPLALMVGHNGSGDLAVNLAEFKVWIP